MTARHRKQIEADVTALMEAFARGDADPPMEPIVRLLSRGLSDFNRLVDAVEVLAAARRSSGERT